MNPTVEAEQATRRAQVVEALADAVATPAVADRLGPKVFLAETRAFFAPRAASWEQHFPHDDPAYAAAVAEVGLRPGQTALDAGCGTGRALPHLWAAVAPGGQVLGFDLTPEMLATARDHGRHAHALLALADTRRLPLPTGMIDGAFAAGLLPHLPDPAAASLIWPGSSGLVAASSCSTPTGGSPWPHATAGACARTTSLPPTHPACCWIALAGGWPATTTAPTGSSPSPNDSPRNLDLLPIPALTARTGTQPHQAGTEVGHECLALRSANPETSRLICRILSQELISIV
jgi:2-polyprenyl-3-methyl-5-hydroxy-6-metoxy-1,4-benzoquinol methylase